MGILNITPDSFADGGAHFDRRARGRGRASAWSRTAPTSSTSAANRRVRAPSRCPTSEELRRVLPVIERLARAGPVPISIDTYKARVAREAVARGATIVNDISGLQYDAGLGRGRRGDRRGADPDAHARALARHVRPRRLRRSSRPRWRASSARPSSARVRAGVSREAIYRRSRVRLRQDARSTARPCWRISMPSRALDRPILSGPSRKSFLKAGARRAPAGASASGERARRSRRACCFGAHIVRVHGVRADGRRRVASADLVRSDARWRAWQSALQ